MNTGDRPLIAVTMGDAAGIGPEIIVKTMQLEEIYHICRPVVVGESKAMLRAIELLQSQLRLNIIGDVAAAAAESGGIDLLDLCNLDPMEVTVGQVCAACGRAAMEFISRAAGLVISGAAGALVTTPISKEATRLAGYADMGHLEYLAHLTGAAEYATMLVSGPLSVVHLTTHYSLREACGLVTKERVLAKLRLTHDSFLKWGVPPPSIAVAALNPHAGEGGLLGREEIEELEPAVRGARALGIDARGPLPADSVFNRAISGEFDVVLALYHDQGHIPIKVYGFEQSVSVALGLPFVRTSVDHGTAFDIAGKGVADAESLAEAIKTAVRLAEGR